MGNSYTKLCCKEKNFQYEYPYDDNRNDNLGTHRSNEDKTYLTKCLTDSQIRYWRRR